MLFLVLVIEGRYKALYTSPPKRQKATLQFYNKMVVPPVNSVFLNLPT